MGTKYEFDDMMKADDVAGAVDQMIRDKGFDRNITNLNGNAHQRYDYYPKGGQQVKGWEVASLEYNGVATPSYIDFTARSERLANIDGEVYNIATDKGGKAIPPQTQIGQ